MTLPAFAAQPGRVDEDERLVVALDDLPPLRDVIREHSLSARKSLGQNFLLDLNLTARIARAAGPLEGATIIEVGPGPGGLTRALLALGARRVIAVERDVALEEYLESGTRLQAGLSADLVATIFSPYSPLHDGAIVVRLEKLKGLA